MKIQYQSPHCIVFESAIFRTTTTLLIASKHIVLVDPNTLPIELSFIKEYIDNNYATQDKYLLFTHSDYDHIVGYGMFEDYNTMASQNFVDNPSKMQTLYQMKEFDDEHYISRDYQLRYPSIQVSISQDKEVMKLDANQYNFYQARGHNSDGLITYAKDIGVLVVGDYLSNVEFPFVYDSFENYLGTLEVLEKIIKEEATSLLVPGHGDVTDDIEEMLQRVADSRTYLVEIKESVKTGKEFRQDYFLAKYDFAQSIKKYHFDNLSLLEKEFNKQT